jgi:two-component system phosphate regulon sensor histidine kinase PhoR
MVKNNLWRVIINYFFILLIFLAILQFYFFYHLNLGWALLTSFIFALGLGWILFKQVISPLKKMNMVTKAISQGNLNQELPLYEQKEINQLAQNINDLVRQQKKVLAQITAEKNRIQTILNSMMEGVIALDNQGNILLLNSAVENFLGIAQETYLGKNILHLIRNYDLERAVKQALKSEKSITQELQLIYPEPSFYYLKATPLKNQEQGKKGIVILLRNSTKEKKLDQMRTEFVANVSHELRTPLTSISSFLETLRDGAIDDPAAAHRILEIMSKETSRLAKLIDDLLHLSKIEERRVVHRWQLVQLKEIINQVTAMFQPQAQQKSLSLTVELPVELPCVSGDPDLLAQVLTNLVDNAIKYTPPDGHILIRAATDKDNVQVEVKDTGIGIPPEDLPRVFERFYRVEKARARELGGIGVGLAIVKHIIKAHGGSIKVESIPHQGSTFKVTLPAELRGGK